MAVIGTLVTDVSADTTKFSRGMAAATERTHSFARDVSAIISGIAIADIGKRIVGGLWDAGKGIVGLAAQAETMRIEMEVLTGSAEEGGLMFKRMERFAARTSFTLESAAEAASQLMAKGIPSDEVMSTMNMLGNLARGNSEKLQLIAKAYTDVRAKGKLMAQETNQFAENGVNIFEALAKTTGKTTQELIAMREAGGITFQMVEEALKGMTAEGGRFGGMMDRMNKTFTGQFNSLIENIQTVGRDLGALVLPKLTEMVSKVNDAVSGFNAMGEGKWKFLSDIIIAGFDVGIETVKLHWAEMLNELIDKTSAAMLGISKIVTDPFAGLNINDLRVEVKPQNLEAAKAKLDALMNQLNAAGEAAANQAAIDVMPFVGPRQQNVDGEKVRGLVGDMIERAKPVAKQFGDQVIGKFEEWKRRGEWLGKTFGRILKQDVKGAEFSVVDDVLNIPLNKPQTQFASAMQKNSAEAFSTILAAAIKSPSQDPVVKATEKQTKQLIAGLKPQAGAMVMQIGAVAT